MRDDAAARRIRGRAHPGLKVIRRSVNPDTGKMRGEIVVGDVRDAMKFLNRTATGGGWRIVIVDPVDEMNRNAANALLKSLEEPPVKCLFLLINHVSGTVLPTIRSRCQVLALPALGPEDLRMVLSAAAPDLAVDEAVLDLAGGSPGRAIRLLEADAGALESRIGAILAAPEEAGGLQALDLAEQVARPGRRPPFASSANCLGAPHRDTGARRGAARDAGRCRRPLVRDRGAFSRGRAAQSGPAPYGAESVPGYKQPLPLAGRTGRLTPGGEQLLKDCSGKLCKSGSEYDTEVTVLPAQAARRRRHSRSNPQGRLAAVAPPAGMAYVSGPPMSGVPVRRPFLQPPTPRGSDGMTDKPKFYITTAISYVNGAPHLGHAYEAISTDVIARYKRLDGHDVFFLTGTDEHGQKVESSARAQGMEPKAFCDMIAAQFKEMTRTLNISNDGFIRTTEPRHYESTRAIWQKLVDAGDIYLGSYAGWYSVRDEAYIGEDELVKDGDRWLTPGGAEVEWIEEPSYFFRLSAYTDKLIAHYEANPGFAAPPHRRNELMNFMRQGLKDLSVSRTIFNWGVSVPGGQRHIVYVWLDALTNYITAPATP